MNLRKASILLLTIDRFEMTRQVLEQALRNAAYPYELLVWDNGSSDPRVIDYIRSKRPALHHLNGSNLGTPQALNQLRLRAAGDYIVFIGNDILLPRGWLKELVDCNRAIPASGVSGIHCVMSCPEVSTIPGRRGNVYSIRQSSRVFGTMFFHRNLGERLGAFCEDYGVYGFWDSDWTERARLAGCTNYYHYRLRSRHIGADTRVHSDYRRMKDESLRRGLARFSRNMEGYSGGAELFKPMPKPLASVEGPGVETCEPRITVALPVYESARIVWLALESLAAQRTTLPWELIVLEEPSADWLGESRLMAWKEPLSAAGCVGIKYIALDTWTPLPRKWRQAGRSAAASSRAFLFQAADCFSHPHRLEMTYRALSKEGFQWYNQRRGVFYDLATGRCVLYNGAGYSHPCGLNIGTRTSYARGLPEDDRRSCVDSWLFDSVQRLIGKPPRVYWDDSDQYLSGVDTHGANRISRGRGRYFANPVKPFFDTPITIESILGGRTLEKISAMRSGP